MRQTLTRCGNRFGSIRTLTVTAGSHEMEVTKDGFTSWTKRFRIFRNGKLEFSVVLKPLTKPAGSSPSLSRTLLPDGEPGLVKKFEGHEKLIMDVTFSADGRFVLSTGGDWTVRLWDVVSGEQVRSFSETKRTFGRCDISTDGRLVAGGNFNGKLWIWDRTSGKRIREISAHSRNILGLAFSPDCKKLLTCGYYDKTARLWDVESGQEIHRYECEVPFLDLAFSPDGRTAIFALRDTGHGEAVLWDVEKGEEIRRISKQQTGNFLSIRFSPDGRSVLTAAGSGLVRLWSVETGEQLRLFKGHTARVITARFLPDGRHIVSSSYDKTLRVWNVATGEEVHRFEADNHSMNRVAVSPDGRFAVSGGGTYRDEDGESVFDGDNALRLWRLPKASEVDP